MMVLIILMLNVIRINDIVKTTGTVTSRNIVYVKSPCDTYLKEVYVVPGEEVKRGQLLAKLDDIGIRTHIQDLKAQIIEAENRKAVLNNENNTLPWQVNSMEQDILQSRSKLNYAREVHESNVKLYKGGTISFLEFKNSQKEVETLQADLARLENSLKIYKIEKQNSIQKNSDEIRVLDSKIERIKKQLNLLNAQFQAFESDADDPRIIAPYSGVITAIGDDDSSDDDDSNEDQSKNFIGKTFQVNDTIFRISDPDDIFIESSIKEKDFPYVFEGDKVTISFPAYPTEQFGTLQGTIQKLYREPTNLSGAVVYKCEIKVYNPDANKNIKTYLGLSTSNTVDAKNSYSLLEYMIKKIFENQ